MSELPSNNAPEPKPTHGGDADHMDSPSPDRNAESAQIETEEAETTERTETEAFTEEAARDEREKASARQAAEQPKTDGRASALANTREDADEDERPSLWQKFLASAQGGQAKTDKTTNRASLRQNKTGMFALAGAAIVAMAVWMVYVVSSPMGPPARKTTEAGAATAASQPQPTPAKSMTPETDAQTQAPQSNEDGSITAEDIKATGGETANRARPQPSSGPNGTDPSKYGLDRIPPPPEPASTPTPSLEGQKNPLDQPSLIFVRSSRTIQGGPSGSPGGQGSAQPISWTPTVLRKEDAVEKLQTGTRLIARLETPASSAITLPVVASVEYTYENSDHELAVPAGSKVFGMLEQADQQGFVGLHFTSLQRPNDAAPIPFDARAIGLDYKPLKGVVTGKNTGRRFLIRALSGMGSLAASTVGVSSSANASGNVSNNVLLREQLSNNIGTQSDQELQNLSFSQHVVVTVPGNTELYLVIDHTSTNNNHGQSQAPQQNVNAPFVPQLQEVKAMNGLSADEIRQWLALQQAEQQKTSMSTPALQNVNASPIAPQ